MVEADDDGNVLELFLSRNNLSGEFVVMLLTDDGKRVTAARNVKNNISEANIYIVIHMHMAEDIE